MRRACAFALALCACSSAPFEGLAPARNRGGPVVQFNLAAQPFPAVPFPNDVLTRADPTSPTGVRLNAPLIAPSELEARMRGLLDTLDGFGTFAPISVSFDKDLDVLESLRPAERRRPVQRRSVPGRSLDRRHRAAGLRRGPLPGHADCAGPALRQRPRGGRLQPALSGGRPRGELSPPGAAPRDPARAGGRPAHLLRARDANADPSPGHAARAGATVCAGADG